MQTLYVGTYTAVEALGLEDRGIGAKIYLHCLDPNTYVLGDDVDGLCFSDVPVPAKIGKKAMDGDLDALAEVSGEVAALFSRPQFKFATGCIVTETDPSLLNVSRRSGRAATQRR